MNRVVQLLAITLVAASASVSSAQAAPTWLRSTAPDGSFSVETKCTKAEVDDAGVLPARIAPGVELATARRVVCFKDGLMFVAGVIDGSFDALLADIRGDKTVEGTPTLTATDGHRSFLNRQVEGNKAALTGFIEKSPSQLIFLLSGPQKDGATSVAEQQELGDRFAASIRISAGSAR